MTIAEFKQLIEQRAGVPASLLQGTTPEEILSSAKGLLSYRQQNEADRPKTTVEQFSSWFNATTGEGAPADDPGVALDELAEMVRRARGGYPNTPDAGEADHAGHPDARPVREQFADWFSQKTAWDPRRDDSGWTRII